MASDTASDTADDKGRTPLACAADAGDVDLVVKLLASADIDVDERDYDGCTPLALAARNGHTAVIEKLLAHDANPSLRDLQQVAPLWIAAKHGYVSVVRLLLASEGLSDVNPRPLKLYPHGTGSPLSIALVEGHQETAGLLAYASSIDISMETDIVDPKTGIVSLLGLAVRDGYEDVALTLLDKCDLGDVSEGTGSIDGASGNGGVVGDAVESASRLLVFAAYSGCYRIAQKLLAKRGANPNAVYEYAIGGDRDCVQQSPLMAASRRGHAGVVRLLLDTEGIQPGLSVDNGTTALILAASGGFLDVVKMLLAHPRVEADHKDEYGQTALSYAAEHAHEAIVAELLATGVVDPNSQDDWAETPLYHAVMNNAPGIVTAIIEHPKTDPQGKPEYSALVWAAREGYTDVVRVLLNSGRVDVNAADTDNFFRGSLLIAASGSGKQDVVRLLLSFPGIDPNAQNLHGGTALINASENGKAEVVEQLLAAGADPNLESWGDIPLMKAAENGQAEVVEQLLAAGVDPNLQNRWGTTPLMEAAQNSQGEVIKQLLAAGVDPNIQDNKGKTALRNAARSSCSTEMAIRVLVEAPGVNADLPDNMGRTALSLAAEAGSFDNVVTLLAVDGVNPDARDATGRSPLSWVFGRDLQCMGPDDADWQRERLLDDHKAIVRRLLDIPTVDPNAVDAEGLTPLLRAVSSYHSSEFVELLLSRPGLNVNCQGPDGLSPLAVAKRARDTVTMAVLRARGATMLEDTASGIPRTTNSRPHPNTSLATVSHFYLMECSTRRVLPQEKSEAGRPPPYVALSYVWGQPPSDQQQHQTIDESLGVIPAVVQDAIHVTLELGYEYLWVDRYCIIQTGSETIKQEQLRHMHTVYANAEVTLVDAAGEGTSTGLLGAPGRPRIPPTTSARARRGPRGGGPTRRAWSHAVVFFFSKYEMSYECRDMLCREALRLPPAVEQRMPRQGLRFIGPYWMYTRRMLPQMSFSRDGAGLFVLLEVYSARQLSKPLDTLNAMLGILQLLAQHKHRPVYHVCGVPVLYTNDKAFNINDDSTAADPTDSDEDSIPVQFRFNDDGPAPIPLDGFVNGLCWHLQQPARRRPDFPSWSWTGWQGRIKRMDPYMPYIMQFFGFNIDVSIMPRYGDGRIGSTVPWNRYFDQLRTADDSSKDLWSGQNHILEIMASAATVRFRRPAEAFEVPGEWTGIVCVGNDVWQGQFSLTFSGEGDSNVIGTESLMSQLVQKPWVGIVLGNARPLPRSIGETDETHKTWVLVVQEEQSQKQPAADGHVYWERVGLLRLDNCTLKEGMLERRTWRLK
ncbi:hypothetical protein CEP52_014257 [Fusarium oligoseptatum]|uniref:Heterokaryon incompatibility domain-containing protein n=1 Tax=Fusarium oligoseptatum TaxID=2604345 RepID=A0A428SNT5_9HYPO|nr:hypothetical protein CEP52_014257 [Fusarium oligoseptatum]